MVTPKRNEIIQRALELWKHDRFRNGQPYEINPTIQELAEDGFLSVAQTELMRSEDSEYRNHIEKEARELGIIKDESDVSEELVEDVLFDIEEALRTGFFICGTSGTGKTNLAKWLVQKLVENGITVYVIDASQSWLRNSPITKSVVVEPYGKQTISWRSNENVVFDVSRLYVKDQRRFVELFCSQVFNAHVQGYVRNWEFLVFEETQLYLPNHSLKSKVYQEVMRLVTSGRNFKIRFGLITQFASLVDKTVVKITKQRYFGYTDEQV